MTTRRNFLTIAGAASLGVGPTFQIARAQSKKLRFGVGPFLPSAEDTKKSFTPVFAHLAKAIRGSRLRLASQHGLGWAGSCDGVGPT